MLKFWNNEVITSAEARKRQRLQQASSSAVEAAAEKAILAQEEMQARLQANTAKSTAIHKTQELNEARMAAFLYKMPTDREGMLTLCP